MKTELYKLSTKNYQINDFDETDYMKFLYEIGDYFNKVVFKNELNAPLKKFILSIEFLSKNTLGTYKKSNGMGFSNIITINAKDSLFQNLTFVSSVLLHEMFHEYQDLYDPRQSKTRWYHDKRFLLLSQKYIPTNKHGQFQGVTIDFINLLKKSNLIDDIDENLLISDDLANKLLIYKKEKAKQTTRQLKWTCGCTNIRCAVDLDAICQKCLNKFIKV